MPACEVPDDHVDGTSSRGGRPAGSVGDAGAPADQPASRRGAGAGWRAVDPSDELVAGDPVEHHRLECPHGRGSGHALEQADLTNPSPGPRLVDQVAARVVDPVDADPAGDDRMEVVENVALPDDRHPGAVRLDGHVRGDAFDHGSWRMTEPGRRDRRRTSAAGSRRRARADRDSSRRLGTATSESTSTRPNRAGRSGGDPRVSHDPGAAAGAGGSSARVR
jgi:hypothetical protein